MAGRSTLDNVRRGRVRRHPSRQMPNERGSETRRRAGIVMTDRDRRRDAERLFLIRRRCDCGYGRVADTVRAPAGWRAKLLPAESVECARWRGSARIRNPVLYPIQLRKDVIDYRRSVPAGRGVWQIRNLADTMRNVLLAYLVIFSVTQAVGADRPIMKRSASPKGPIPCQTVGGRNFCHAPFQATCKKGNIFTADPGEGKNVTLYYPPQRGFQFVPGTGFCVRQEVHGTGFITLESMDAHYMVINSGCQATVQSDAFVYGYCEANATTVSWRHRKSWYTPLSR